MASQPEYRASQCTRYRYRYSNCSRCADVCQYDALVLSEEGISISPSACRNCSLCVSVCPTQALTTVDLQRNDILKRASTLAALTISCAPSGLKADEVVPCLGSVDAATLAHLSSRGVQLTLAGKQHCSDCAHGENGERQLELHLQAVAELNCATGGDHWGDIVVPVNCGGQASKADGSAARRHLFRRLIGRGVDEIARPVTQGDAAPTPLKAIRFARQFSTPGREALQALLDKTVHGGQSPLPAHPAILAAQLEAPDGCTACEACARACPTGAIEVRESGVGWELAFEFSRCVGCNVCTEACQPRVLHLAPMMYDWKVPQAVVLQTRSKQRCNRCDRFFVSPEPADMCPVCSGDDEDFASLFG